MSKRLVKILAIDGGGIRGLIPALILKELKKRLKEKGKESSLIKNFDIISGCSTGGILALGLAKPKIKDGRVLDEADLEIEDLIDFYENHGEKIFPDSLYRRIRQTYEEKYNETYLEKVLEEKLGDVELKDALKNVLIPAYNIEKRKTHFFKKRPERFGDKNYYMKDVARATSAAPTYFEPAKINAIGEEKREIYVDGGMFENNPAMAAYIEAMKIYPDSEYMIISLGTGMENRPFYYEDARNWGMVGWAAPWKGVPILSILMSAQGISVDHQLKNIPKLSYFRFNSELENCKDELDNTSIENMTAIKELAEKIIQIESEKIDQICNLL